MRLAGQYYVEKIVSGTRQAVGGLVSYWFEMFLPHFSLQKCKSIWCRLLIQTFHCTKASLHSVLVRRSFSKLHCVVKGKELTPSFTSTNIPDGPYRPTCILTLATFSTSTNCQQTVVQPSQTCILTRANRMAVPMECYIVLF
jgi:hypothetical protein